jgi:protein-S-isoprenylcysteine O-methyltransferase Ste14
MRMHNLLIVGAWVLFGVSHSLLAGSTLDRLFGRYSRLAFNGLAVVTTALPFALLASAPAHPLWADPAWLQMLRPWLIVAVALAFFHTLKFYSMSGFLGLKAETWPLTFSPWHCRVRHPWYFLLLVFIWVQAMTDTWLVTALCMSLYLVIGSRLEEQRILLRHPGSYAQYRQLVPALIPWRGRALDEATRVRLEAQALTETS